MSHEMQDVVARQTAFAKINLALHVRGRRKDGYHQLETIFAFVDKGDVVSAQASDHLSLSISGPFGENLSTDYNLILSATHLFAAHFDQDIRVKLSLEKNLPVASGIGGGSADAAATLRLLNDHYQTRLPLADLADIARPLGADVPACVLSHTCRGEGTGTDLSIKANDPFANFHILLVNPNIALSTADVFAGWGERSGQDRGGLPACQSKEEYARSRNDLQDIAAAQHAEIQILLNSLAATSADFVRMSGSGATCFALFAEHHVMQEACKQIKALYPKYWTMTGQLR